MATSRHLGFGPTGNGAIQSGRSGVPENPTLEKKHRVDWMTCCRVMSIRSFPKFDVGCSSVNIHTSYSDLIYSSFTVLGMQRTRSNKTKLFL